MVRLRHLTMRRQVPSRLQQIATDRWSGDAASKRFDSQVSGSRDGQDPERMEKRSGGSESVKAKGSER